MQNLSASKKTAGSQAAALAESARRIATEGEWNGSPYREFAGMHERRRYMRFPVEYQVRVTHGGGAIDARLRDMSISGLFVTTTFRIPVADAVDVTIYNDDHPSRICNLSGTVVRSTDSGLAIRLDKTLLEL